jgi:RNA polymerase sigma-B factor
MAESIGLHQDPEGLVMRYLENPRDDLRDLIMVQYSNLVERVARRFSGLEAYEDLVQVGFIGLLNALSKFDRNAGVRFNTYATYLVAGEIKHYLRDKSQTIRHPAWLQELRHKVKKSASMLQHKLGRLPTEGEIAEDLGVSETSVREVFQTEEMLKVASLDAPPQGEEDAGGEVDNLDAAAFCPEQLSVEDRLVLENAMRQLRDLERQVLVHFHFDAMNQTEIANKLGISCNYVSHILRQSLSKLRKILSNEEEKDRVLRREVAAVDYEVMDALLDCYTEDYMRARLEEELHRASCENGAVAVVMINFTGLDTLRTFYGDASVTDFLASASEFLRDNVRRLDVVGRYGQGGFMLLLPSTGPAVAVVRQRLLQRIGSWLNGRLPQNGPVHVEIGHGCYPEDARTVTELLDGMQMLPLEELTHPTGALKIAA